MTVEMPRSEINRFRQWTDRLTVENKRQCQRIIVDCTEKTKQLAMQLAPVDYGILNTQLHTAYSSDKLSGKVYTNVGYAPYQEWGTGNKVRVPAYVKDIFGVDSMDWKGAGMRKVNIKPHPYLFGSANISRLEMIAKLGLMGFRKV